MSTFEPPNSESPDTQSPPEPLRYAHPFYTSAAPADRPADSRYGQRAKDWSHSQLGPIPKPVGESVMVLSDVIGSQGSDDIQAAGSIRFHAVGDTGLPGSHSDNQQEVADDMTQDYHPDSGGNNPAFFLHLGDVIYGPQKEEAYRDEFYRPYFNYPGKIIAIPGNHDGEIFSSTDPVALQAFQDNFCQPSPAVPPVAQQVGILREMVAQPGVYWLLDAPFVQIIGLYSNSLENPGSLEGANGDQTQKDWLARALGGIALKRSSDPAKALIIATHHPPFSGGGHSGSTDMLAEIDAACQQSGVMYDAILSGHAHNYQRYTRRVSFQGSTRQIPFIVAGGGGHGLQAVDSTFNAQPQGDHTFDFSLKAYSYLLLTVSPQQLKIDMWQLPSQSQPTDSVTVNLQTHQLM